MRPEEEKFIHDLQEKNEQIQSGLDFEQMSRSQRETMMHEKQQSIAVEQLNMTEEIERMNNLLRGRYQQMNKDGEMEWIDPTDTSSIFLSESGVQFVLNSISFYLNKNTLLSNYDEDTINKKMEDYSESLADVLFMRSHIYFLEPNYEEVVEEYEKLLQKNIDKQLAIAKIKGINVDEEKLKEKLLFGVDIEKAIEGLKQQMKNDKLKGFEHLCRVIQDSVHSAYLRALNGQERRSLRASILTTENIGQPKGIHSDEKTKFSWFKK